MKRCEEVDFSYVFAMFSFLNFSGGIWDLSRFEGGFGRAEVYIYIYIYIRSGSSESTSQEVQKVTS